MTPAATRLFQTQRVAAVEQREMWLRIAHHESGHAIVGYHLGLDVTLLRIELPASGPHPDGRCRFARPPYETMSLSDELVMSAAGGLADAKRSGFDSGTGTDLHDVLDPVMRYCDGDADAATAMLLNARRRAAELVDRFWDEICELARALADAGTMTQAIEPYLAAVPRRPTTAGTEPARSRPAEIAPRPRPADPAVRVRGFTPQAFEIRGRDGEHLGETIALPDGRFAAWSEGKQKFIGTFSDRIAAANAL